MEFHVSNSRNGFKKQVWNSFYFTFLKNEQFILSFGNVNGHKIS